MTSTAENRPVNMKLALIFIFRRAASSAGSEVDRIGVDEALDIAVAVAAEVFRARRS